jgi:MFS superfamily sulfate permease-like transporter
VIDGKLYYLIKLPQHVTFFNKGYLIKFFGALNDDSKLIIDASINRKMNRDAKDVIDNFINIAKHRKIEVELIKYK